MNFILMLTRNLKIVAYKYNMEQLTLENKVNNTLKWLANKIGCIQVYHLDENIKRYGRKNHLFRKRTFKFWHVIQFLKEGKACRRLHYSD